MSAIPGWRLVPEVATDKMIDAGEASFRELTYPTPADAYRAMLAAAPTPPEVAADLDAVRFCALIEVVAAIRNGENLTAAQQILADALEEETGVMTLDTVRAVIDAALAAKGAE